MKKNILKECLLCSPGLSVYLLVLKYFPVSDQICPIFIVFQYIVWFLTYQGEKNGPRIWFEIVCPICSEDVHVQMTAHNQLLEFIND